MSKTTTIRLSDEIRQKIDAESADRDLTMTTIIENSLRVHYGMNELGLASRVARLEARLKRHFAAHQAADSKPR